MAIIKSADMSATIRRKKVVFAFKLEMEFRTQELNSHWAVLVGLIERDVFTDDSIISTCSPTFVPKRKEFSFNFQIPVAKSAVKTEPGKEEVYALLTLGALENEAQCEDDSIRTNEIKVDV